LAAALAAMVRRLISALAVAAAAEAFSLQAALGGCGHHDSACTPGGSRPQLSRRAAVALTGSTLFLPLRSEAKKGKGGGDAVTALSGADPADKVKLEEAVNTILGLEDGINDPDRWAEVITTISKPPFTKEAMDSMFLKAAKLLPSNIQKIYGGDGGQWVGLKTEAVDAMDALAAELTFLEAERNKSGKAPTDTADLLQYYALLKEKSTGFLALYSNDKLNSQLKGGGFCAYSSSAKCDEFDDSADVKEAVKAGANYNSLRLGK